jgi:sarcosine oxidase subunit alpha
MGGLVTKTKDCLGKRSLTRSDTARLDRKQLVGLLTDDPRVVLTEGAQILNDKPRQIPAPMLGHVTSSYMSPTLERSIALALIKGGSSRIGERVNISMPNGLTVVATITNTVFLDPKAERQNA